MQGSRLQWKGRDCEADTNCGADLGTGGLSFAGSQHDTLTLSFMCSKVKLVVILFDRWLSLTAFKLSHIGQKQESL